MLDLVFRNNQAPALNADNMNRIVNAINENDNKSKELTDEILATNNKINEIMAEKIPEEVISAEVNAYIQEHNSNLAFSKDVANNWNGNGYNLIPFPYYSKSGQLNRGIIYTVNDDGSVIANGTVSETTLDSFFDLGSASKKINMIHLKRGKYIILDGVQNNSDEICWAAVYDANSTFLARSTRNRGVFTVENEIDVFIQLRVHREITVNNLTFHPMLVEVNADGTYPTEYQRYASGNVELTDNKASTVIISEKFDETKSYVEGDYLIYNDTLYKVKVNCSGIVPPNTTYYEAVTVASEVTQLKKSLNDMFGTYEDLTNSAIGTQTTASNITVKDMSNYKFIYAILFGNSNVASEITVPIGIFRAKLNHLLTYNDGSFKYGSIQYVNNTTIKVMNNATNLTMHLYGIK